MVVIMNNNEEKAIIDMKAKIAEAEMDIQENRVSDALDCLKKLREKYNL